MSFMLQWTVLSKDASQLIQVSLLLVHITCALAELITDVQIHLKGTCRSIKNNLPALGSLLSMGSICWVTQAFITVLIWTVTILTCNTPKKSSLTVNCWLLLSMTHWPGHVKCTVEPWGRLWFEPSRYFKTHYNVTVASNVLHFMWIGNEGY